MKRLLPVVLLAGVILGLIGYRRADPRSSLSPTTPTSVRQPAAAAVSSPPTAPALTSAVSAAPLADEISRALRDGSALERDRVFNQLLPRLIARDPASAGHLALAWEPGALREEFLRHVIRLWSAADIGGAVTWLTSLLDPADRALAAAVATAQVAQTDHAGALEIGQLLRVGLDDGSLEHRAQLWTEENPRAALDWITHRPAGPVRDRLLARIAWVRAQSDPTEAARLVLDYMAPGDTRDEALLAIVRQHR